MKNLVIIVIDDLGYKDLGCFGGELYTPNLDALCNSGVKFTQFDAQPVCSPTRAALMTGLFGYKNGIQSIVWPWTPTGLDLALPILPQILKQNGYKTYMIGKWHLGKFEAAYHPHRRGFDYHFGSYNGWIDYWTHQNYGVYDVWENGVSVGLNNTTHMTDFCTNKALNKITQHNPADPMFMYLAFNAAHEPLQEYPVWVDQVLTYNTNIPNRIRFAAMLSHLDYVLGKIFFMLKKKGMWDNTYIWVTSDNGGSHSSDNTPLRNIKGSFYEGGIRVANFLSGPGISSDVNTAPHHVVDIMPTVFSLLDLPLNVPTDGINIFTTPDPNREFVYYVRKKQDGEVIGAIRQGNFKLLKFNTYEMYNLANDPSEQVNLVQSNPTEATTLLNRLKQLAPTARWNLDANAWNLRPHAETDNQLPTEEDTMTYALGLHGFSSIND